MNDTLTLTPASTSTKVKPSRKRPSPAFHLSGTKKPRKSRRIHDFPPESLAPYFHMPQRQAAEALNVAVITIKRNCKRYGFKWPYRANKYKASKTFVRSEKGRAFHELPRNCLKAENQFEPLIQKPEECASECDTDTESVGDDDQVKKDYCQILFSLHKAPIHSPTRESNVAGDTIQ